MNSLPPSATRSGTGSVPTPGLDRLGLAPPSSPPGTRAASGGTQAHEGRAPSHRRRRDGAPGPPGGAEDQCGSRIDSRGEKDSAPALLPVPGAGPRSRPPPLGSRLLTWIHPPLDPALWRGISTPGIPRPVPGRSPSSKDRDLVPAPGIPLANCGPQTSRSRACPTTKGSHCSPVSPCQPPSRQGSLACCEYPNPSRRRGPRLRPPPFTPSKGAPGARQTAVGGCCALQRDLS